jgi:DNA polymerase I-like protein with 3'-5' exonuclease and polymerase domains
MTRTYFDLEADNLYWDVTKVHCIATLNDADGPKLWTDIPAALEYLDKQDIITAHNGINYDVPVLDKLYGWKPKAKVEDTLVMSRVIFPHLYDYDFKMKRIDAKSYGSHSLDAWGLRVGEHKQKFEGPWDLYTEEMGEYCVQDVVTLKAVHKYLESQNLAESSYELEHKVATICNMMHLHGFKFDRDKANDLYATLSANRNKIQQDLTTLFPERVEKRVSERTGKPLKDKVIQFNPGSRDHITYWLKKKYNWEPKSFTPSGKPEVNEEILLELPWPEAQALAEYFQLQKVIGMLAEGDAAWLKLEREGWLHGTINTNGAVTGRATHRNPNMAQVPSGRTKYGKGIRSMFTVRPGYKLVGVDMSGLELRCLSHYLALYDKGEYAHEVIQGDIHWTNAQAAGFIPKGTIKDESIEEHKQARKKAKLFIYAFIYGAGDAKIGLTLNTNQKGGKEVKEKFLTATPAIAKLRADVKKAVDTRGYLVGLDGRKLHVRSAHAAVNTLLQSAGAVTCKQWLVYAYERAIERGWEWDKDFALCAWVHDELQWEVREEIAEDFAKMVVECNALAGEQFKFRCPLDGDSKIGNNWMETH